MKRPVGVTIVSVLAIIGGALVFLSSLGYLGLAALRTSMFIGVISGLSPSLVLGTGVISLIVGVMAIAFGFGALSMKSWAWLTGVVVWGTSLVLSVVQLAVTGIALIPTLTAVVAVAILGYLSSAPVREALGVQTGEHYTTHHPSAV